MSPIDRLIQGLAAGFQPEALLVIGAGVIIGMLVGAAPGMGPTMGMAVTAPFVFRESPETAVFLFVGILVGSNFGNSIPAVLVRVPGTAGALLTAIEGYPFQARGEGGRALVISLYASTVCQLVGIVVFIVAVVPLSEVAIKFLFPEMFALVVFGMLAAAGVMGRSRLKGMIAIVIGLLLATIGPDPITSMTRLGFGVPDLDRGLSTIPILVGMLAFREVFLSFRRPPIPPSTVRRLEVRPPSLSDIKETMWPIGASAAIGTGIGALPGAGSVIAQFVVYNVVRLFSRKKHLFGRGSPEALAAVDGSNNASAAGELIPTLGIGIPGSPSMVVIMAVLTAQGMIPGPQILETRPSLLYATFGGLLAAAFLTAIIGYLSIWPSVYITRLPQTAVMATTMVLVVVGVYALQWSMFDVWVAFAAGLLGYLMTRYEYPIAPAALAYILGGILEANLRRGLVMVDGPLGFLMRPGTLFFLLAALFMLLVVPVLLRIMARRAAAATARAGGIAYAGEAG